MRRLLLLLFIILSLFLAPYAYVGNQVLAQTPDEYSLELQGFIWDHPTITTLAVTPGNASWWNTAYLNSTLRAIGQWNDAVANFALNNSEFSYLSNVRFEYTVSDIWQPGFDVYINWTDSSLSGISDEVGLATITPNAQRAIINCSIILAVHTNHGDALDEGDAQNIATHELGHGLGLGHANYSADVMYSTYTLQGPRQGVSTLDGYGVATLFAWQLNLTNLYPISRWLTENSVILPSNIPYEYLPVSEQNSRPNTLTDNPILQQLALMLELILHPPILAAITAFLAFCIIAGVLLRRRRSHLVRADS